MNKTKTILAILLTGFVIQVHSLELTSGVISKGKDTIRNDQERLASPIITQLVKTNGGKPGIGIGYTNLGEGSIWYRFYSKNVVVGVNSDTNEFLGKWPLTSYAEAITLNGEREAADRYLIEALYDADPQSEEPENPDYRYDSYLARQSDYGCLLKTPLRYGDIEEDGANELLLFLSNQIVIFSTEVNEVVFSARYFQKDQMRADLQSHVLSPEGNSAFREDYADLGDQAPQYLTSSGLDIRVDLPLPARRSYAKLYFGDFDGDDQFDIVVWRKRYESKVISDAVAGFELHGELLLHYEKSDGSYHRQATEEATIKQWLANDALTWQKGYPNRSECEGEAGQLITEMHDPLLNDPEVLP